MIVSFGAEQDEAARWPSRRQGLYDGPWGSGRTPADRQIEHKGGAIVRVSPDDVSEGCEPLLHTERVGAWNLWALGELHGYAPENAGAATGKISRSEPDSHGGRTARLLRAFARDLAQSRERPAALNGRFLLLALDGRTGHWHVWTDRFGTIHGYYGRRGNRAAVGSFSPAVARAVGARTLDWLGLAGYFATACFFEAHTHFEEVEILRPATHYTFGRDGRLLSAGRYWDWRHDPDPTRSFEDTLAAFDRAFRDAVDDLSAGVSIALPVSGGLDSRTNAAALTRRGSAAFSERRVWAYSYGYGPRSSETRVARQVAAARSIPFRAFEVPQYLFDRLDATTATMEGFQDVTLPRQIGMIEEVGERTGYVMPGHWGGAWFGDFGFARVRAQPGGPPTERGYADAVLDIMWRRGSDWLLDRLSPRGLAADARSLILETQVKPCLARLSHVEDLSFRTAAFLAEQIGFRWANTGMRGFQLGAFPREPFYDTRVADFFCTVPGEMHRGRRLQVEYLKRYAPDLARVEWEGWDADLFTYNTRRRALTLPKRALRRGWARISGRRPAERNWEVQFAGEYGRNGLEKWLLAPGLRLHEYVDTRDVDRLLHDFQAAPLEQMRGHTISSLLTFSAWLEKYG